MINLSETRGAGPRLHQTLILSILAFVFRVLSLVWRGTRSGAVALIVSTSSLTLAVYDIFRGPGSGWRITGESLSEVFVWGGVVLGFSLLCSGIMHLDQASERSYAAARDEIQSGFRHVRDTVGNTSLYSLFLRQGADAQGIDPDKVIPVATSSQAICAAMAAISAYRSAFPFAHDWSAWPVGSGILLVFRVGKVEAQIKVDDSGAQCPMVLIAGKRFFPEGVS